MSSTKKNDELTVERYFFEVLRPIAMKDRQELLKCVAMILNIVRLLLEIISK